MDVHQLLVLGVLSGWNWYRLLVFITQTSHLPFPIFFVAFVACDGR
jgi:hypothetical protein